jgi:hypothetical protein
MHHVEHTGRWPGQSWDRPQRHTEHKRSCIPTRALCMAADRSASGLSGACSHRPGSPGFDIEHSRSSIEGEWPRLVSSAHTRGRCGGYFHAPSM